MQVGAGCRRGSQERPEAARGSPVYRCGAREVQLWRASGHAFPERNPVDEFTLAIAGAVAGKLAESATESVRGGVKALRRALRARFTSQKDAEGATALDDALDSHGADEAEVQVLAGHVTAAVEADPEIARLVEELRPHLTASQTTVTNTINGKVTGTAFQAGTVHGDVTLGR